MIATPCSTVVHIAGEASVTYVQINCDTHQWKLNAALTNDIDVLDDSKLDNS